MALAAVPCVLLYDFTVDDALITGRVAHHIANGSGYRFNAGGPVTDAVTPLGWAYVLAPFASGGAASAVVAAKAMGTLAWLGAAVWLGARVATLGTRWIRFLPLASLTFSVPLALWAVAGMETGLVAGLATLALVRRRLAPLAAGLAAAWRPELIPWAAALALGTSFASLGGAHGVSSGAGGTAARTVARALGLALLPAVGVALLRTLVFGTPMPLAALAKPSDLEHGFRYSLAAFAFAGPPILVLAPRTLRLLDTHGKAILVAGAVHFVAMVAAGGDWMPYSRLAAPILPGLVLVGCQLAEHAPAWATHLRVVAAIALAVSVPLLNPDPRVGGHRRALIEAARAPLAGAEHVATLDAGWVGAATPAEVVELAGVTDIRVAALPGGHTSKRLPERFVESRKIDALVLLHSGVAQAGEWGFDRVVEQRLARFEKVGDPESRWGKVAEIPLGATEKSYLIFRLREGSSTH